MNARWMSLFAVALVACAPASPAVDGSTQTDAAADATTTAPSDASANDAAPFDAAGVDPRAAPALRVLVESCGSMYCHHGDGRTPQSRDLSEQHIRGTLALRSLQVPRLRLIEPGRPTDSYLLHKLEGTMPSLTECQTDAGTCGERMPSVPLANEQIAVIRQWITDGAPGL
ncbi:MAG: hypothetical protein JNK05_04840 [Myxococcales bacterium]|nr:hypothetical protein [Myxococcales bacterium]